MSKYGNNEFLMNGCSCDVGFNCCRECPADLKEGVASLIFATPRCSEIPELSALRNVFEKKYGKDFVSAATDLRPNCGVNRLVTTLSTSRSITFPRIILLGITTLPNGIILSTLSLNSCGCALSFSKRSRTNRDSVPYLNP